MKPQVLVSRFPVFFRTLFFGGGPALVLLLAAGVASAQTLDWVNQPFSQSFIGGADQGYAVAYDALGNVYVTGSFAGTADFDPGPGTANLTSAGGDDIFIAKYDASGNYVWANRIGDTGGDIGYGLAVDGSGNVHVTGYFSGSNVDFDPGPGTENLSSAGGIDIFFAKYDASGNYVWAKRVGGTSGEQGRGIAVDGSGNVHLTGSFRGNNVDFDPGPGIVNLSSNSFTADIFFAKYDASGNYVWANRVGSSNGLGDIGYALAVDGSGNVHVTGYFTGTADFDPGAGTVNLTDAGNGDTFIAKYDASGNYVWANRVGGTSGDAGYSLAVDGSGNVHVTGFFQATVDFDPGAGTVNLTSVGNADIFIAKYNASGNYVWAKQVGNTGNNYGNGLALDGSGNVHVTGQFQGTNVDFDPGGSTANLSSAGSDDIFIAKYDASGNYVWARRVGGASIDQGYGLAVDGSGNVHVTGSFYNTNVDFDPGAGTAELSAGASYSDAFALRLSAAGNYDWAVNWGQYNNTSPTPTLMECRAIARDASGNVYATGSFQGLYVDFDPGPGTAYLTSAGNNDIFIAKYDALGNYLWAKRIGGTSPDVGYGIAVDGSGNVYVTGYFQGANVDFDPGAGTANLTSAGGSDIFIAKYDASGNYVWANRVGGTGSDIGYGLAVDGSGNVHVTGYFAVTVDFDPGSGTAPLSSAGSIDVFIAKYDASGNYLWAKRIGATSNDIGYGLALDGSGNVHVTGYFTGTNVDFDPGGSTAPLSSAGGSDIFIAKYDASGNYVWANRVGGTGSDNGYGLALDGSGNVHVTGIFQGTNVDFDPGTGTATLSSAGSLDIFIAKYDASGNYVWAKGVGGTSTDSGNGLALDGSGNVLVTGQFLGTNVDFDPGASTATLSSAGGSDIFIAKYDASGNYVEAMRVGSTNGDIGYCIAAGAAGKVAAGGRFDETVDFDPGAGTSNRTAVASSGDIFIAQYTFTASAPEINLKGNSVSIADGDVTPDAADHTDFENACVSGGTVVRTFTIENTGTGDLTIPAAGITITGAEMADFTVGGISLPATITGGSSTTFTVTFDPSATGLRSATVNIDNNDSDENPYNFDIQGTGNAVTPAVSIAANPGFAITPGTSVTFTATPTNGGATPTYQWKKNNVNVGADSPMYTDATLADGDVITVVMTSSESCADPAAATSNPIAMEVYSCLPDGITWTAQSAAEANSWSSVTYGNGLFVAVAVNGNNRVMTSPDGITWTARTAADVNPWNSVTYGNGLFVAVAYNGANNRVMTSPDGITWTGRNAAAANSWYSVTYGNGLFVAVAGSGVNRVMTSPDGITWTARSAAEANNWYSVTYGNGLFVAVADNGTNRVMTSPDGITWTARSAAEANPWISVTYGNGLFVALSTSGVNRVMTSPDGINWTAQSAPEANPWWSVTYGNGLFVAVAYGGVNRVMTSPDGITWTARTAAEASNWWSVTYGNGLFVAVAYDGINRVMTNPGALPAVSIAANPGNSISAGTSVTFTATPTNGGATPAYQWKKNNLNVGADSPMYTDATLANGDVITVVMTSSDPCANPSTATSNQITMEVCTLPTFTTCPAAPVTANTATGQCAAVVTYSVVASGTPTPVLTYAFTGATTGSGSGTGSGSTFNAGNTTVTVTATNACGTPTCVFTVTVTDNQPPAINCPANITITNDPDECTALVTIPTPTVSDNCSISGGTALDFDGVNEFVSINPVSGLSGADYTIEGWFKNSLTGLNQVILDGFPTGSSNSYLHIMIMGINGTLRFLHREPSGLSGGENLYTSTAVNDGNWHHFAAVKGPDSKIRLYLDGILEATSASTVNNFSSAPELEIGRNHNDDWYFDGTIDEIRIWNIARSADEIDCAKDQLIPVDHPALLAYYRMDEGSGNILVDNSGNSNDGSMQNMEPASWVFSSQPTYQYGTANDFTASCSTAGVFGQGATTVTWTATDAAGITNSCQLTITVIDNQPPAVTCPANQNVPPAMASPCSAIVAGIDAVPSDNCGVPALTYALSGATTGSGSGQASGLSFNAGITTVTYTATDGASLQSNCMFTVTVQACKEISGTILWSNIPHSPVEQATVVLSGSATGSAMTDVNGEYTFSLTALSGNYTLTPSKDINFDNGLFVNDALAIQQHLTGINPITNAYQMIAADVDRSDYLSTFDATVIKQILLGNPAAFNLFNKSWRFVPQSWTPVLPPWGFPEEIELTGVTTDQLNQDFYGIKIGDLVANFADPANFGGGSNSPGPLVLRAEDRLLEQGEAVVVNVTADAYDNLAAWQFGLQFDPQQLQFDSVEVVSGGVLPLTKGDFGLFGLAAGKIRAVWSKPTGVSLPGGTEVFRLHFRALQSGQLLSGVLQLDDKVLPAAAFNSALEQAALELNYSPFTNTQNPDSQTYLLLQNQPNPFTGETAIGFVLPGACNAQLRVFDATGRLLWQHDGDYPAGYSVEKLRLDGLAASGVLFYELTTPYGTLTKRMVRVAR